MKTIFSFITEQSGIGQYRIVDPLGELARQKRIDWLHNRFSNTNIYKTILPYSIDELQKKTVPAMKKILGNKSPDLFLMQRYDNPFYFSLCLSIKKDLGVPVVQEVDDYVYDVPNTNPGKLSYHERHELENLDPNDGLMWQRKSLGHFDAYIVTTNFLKKYYENYGPTYICPNSIDLRKRQFGPHKKHKEIRLGFSASGGHQEGLWFIEPVIDKLMAKYPNLVFYYYGGLFDLFSKKPYAKRVKIMRWANLDHYPKYLHDQDFDIAIAPLADRLFNRGKSNLRLLEYWSAGKYPVVASAVGPYKETIRDGVNGLLANERDEWFDKISMLIERPELRDKLGLAGYDTVVKDYNLEKNARIWERAFNDIIHSYQAGRRSQVRVEDVLAQPTGHLPR